MFHDWPFAGHKAFKTTFEAVRVHYFCLRMARDVEEYCRSCIECQKFNNSCLHNSASLKPLVLNRPFQLIGIDFMGPFHESSRGNKYKILAIDHHTKYAIGAVFYLARGARGRDLKETARDRIKWRMLYYKWGRNAENSEDVTN